MPDNRVKESEWVVPYIFPVQVGLIMDSGWFVVEIGIPLLNECTNEDALVPVRLSNGTHLILKCSRNRVRIYKSDNQEAQRLVSNSTTMPVVKYGVGSDVFHVKVTDPDTNEKVLIKLFYNAKKIEYGRVDEVHR